MEHTRSNLGSNIILCPTEKSSIIKNSSWNVVNCADASIDSHLVLLDVNHLLAGVEHPVEAQGRPRVGVHLTEDFHLGVKAHLVPGGRLGAGADWLV